MITEQLQAARAALWRQNQSPLLTLEDAETWFQQHPLCLYLPRPVQLPAPAPSFVEACSGSRQATPGPEVLEQARSLLIRLVASGAVVPLNLFGTVSEQPDFLAHRDALPFVLSLRADPDWKHAPQKSSGHAVSPLVLELWKAIEKEDSLTLGEARQALGRELTEAAVLRGLCELWQTLRISPVFQADGQPPQWEMLRVHHRAALNTATNTGQVTAISLLVSMYLQSVYAATSDEIGIFLSPVASRSRVREAVRGLAATRQVQSLSMDAQTYYFLEGGLPEFAAEVTPSPAEEIVDTAPAAPREIPRPFPAQREAQATRREDTGRRSSPRPVPAFRRPSPPADRRPRPERPPATFAAKPAQAAPDRQGWKPAAAHARPAKPYGQRPDTARTRPSAPFPGKRGPVPAGRPPQAGAPLSPPARSFAQPGRRPAAAGAKTNDESRSYAKTSSRPPWKGGESTDKRPRTQPPGSSAGGRREGFAPRDANRTGPPRPGGARTGPAKTGTSRNFPPRTGAARSGPPRPSNARTDRQQRPVDRPRSAGFAAQGDRPPRSSGPRPGQNQSPPRSSTTGAPWRPRPNPGPNAGPNARPNARPNAGASARPNAGRPPQKAGDGPARQPRKEWTKRPSGPPGAPGERPRWKANSSSAKRSRPEGGERKGSGSPRPPYAAKRPARSGPKPPSRNRNGENRRKKPGE